MSLLCRAFAVFCLFFLTPVSGFTQVDTAPVSELLPAQVKPETLAIIFSGNETLHYSVSWSGGVKIGDIYLKIRPQKQPGSGYVITAKVKDHGPLSLLYPVDDKFRCFVDGLMKLPTRYEVEQKEGYGRETTRLSEYDQEKHLIRYRKNQDKVQKIVVNGTVYNEFASFIITRALAFTAQDEIIVPTFADRKRHEVKVAVVERQIRKTLFGQQKTLKVEPRMKFKGLYEKSGSTLLWLTDDRCRVPVEIHSRIVVGSLVAELVDYTNSACPELQQKKKK